MVTGPAYGNQHASSALQFAKTLIACGHHISTVFFYKDGVYNANRLTTPASDEVDLVRAWQDLKQQHNVSLHICITAALRRGVIDAEQATTLRENLQHGFQLSSLGTLAQAVLNCDRFIQF